MELSCGDFIFIHICFKNFYKNPNFKKLPKNFATFMLFPVFCNSYLQVHERMFGAQYHFFRIFHRLYDVFAEIRKGFPLSTM